MIFLAATALIILLSVRYMEIEQENHGEFYALILFATIGMMFMVEGLDLVVQFIGLETMALSFYVLVGFLRRERRSNEAALKYLLLGAFSSGILAYGFSLLYGLSGASTNLVSITGAMIHREPSNRLRAAGARHRRRRIIFQNCRRAVPSMGARRLRRRADHNHRVLKRRQHRR